MSFAEYVFFGTAAGLGATLITDLVAIMRQGWGLTHGFYCLVGRWLGSLIHHGPVHDDIRMYAPIVGEAVLGWSGHVVLGILYGIGFSALFGASAFETPQLWQGLGFGLATVLVPWFIFQPMFGWGFAMSKAPEPAKMRLKGLTTHAVFGMGIWLSVITLNALF